MAPFSLIKLVCGWVIEEEDFEYSSVLASKISLVLRMATMIASQSGVL
jgi:hypothetical protein